MLKTKPFLFGLALQADPTGAALSGNTGFATVSLCSLDGAIISVAGLYYTHAQQ